MDSQLKDNRIQPHLPIILTPPQERQDQSQRSLFKNDSLSSAQAQRYAHSKQQTALPEIDQIRKFLRKGDLLNTNTLKKLKQDVQINQIVKKDRSSASLYKVIHTIDFSGEKESKKAEIKRIYMSHRKQPAKLSMRHSFRKPSLASHQVQTDRLQYLQDQQLIQNTIEYNINHLHKPSFVTLDIAQQQTMRTKTRMLPNQVQEDDQQNTLLPLRKPKGVAGRAKALSTQQNQLKDYLQKMGRTQFTFRSSLNKPKEKYREYQQQQTVFSKTIDVKPLIPPKDLINTFNQAAFVQQQNKMKIIQTKNDKNHTNKIGLGPQKGEKEKSKNQAHSVGIQYQQIQNTQKPQNTILPQYSRQADSSLIPQHSELFQQSQSKSRSIYKQAEDLINRVPTALGNRRIFSNRVKKPSKSPKTKNKQSILVQVPSLHQLKIGQQQGEQKIIHPIRQNFGRSELDWMQRIYNPKNDALRNLSQFEIKKYQNGVYYGQLSPEGLKHGKGVIFYFSGKVYEGELMSDMKQGKGHQYFPDGSVFRGEFRQGVKHGRGIYQWVNGEIYDGQWQNGHKTGSGMWTNLQGESYMGQWKNDKVEGFGVFVMKNGSRYQGEFKNSLKHGVGTQRFYNGQTYVGSYQKNRPNGEGEYYWANGDYYKGSFLNGLRHGQGYFKEGKTGIQYRGEYQNDKKCGFGEINYNNSMVYVGNFQNNFRHGYGELLEAGKVKYKGYWVNDRQVDDQNQHINPNKQAEKKRHNSNFKAIEQVLQRQQSLPKPILRLNNRINQAKSPKKTHQHSISPSDKGEGYKRSCGCNKKH